MSLHGPRREIDQFGTEQDGYGAFEMARKQVGGPGNRGIASDISHMNCG